MSSFASIFIFVLSYNGVSERFFFRASALRLCLISFFFSIERSEEHPRISGGAPYKSIQFYISLQSSSIVQLSEFSSFFIKSERKVTQCLSQISLVVQTQYIPLSLSLLLAACSKFPQKFSDLQVKTRISFGGGPTCYSSI